MSAFRPDPNMELMDSEGVIAERGQFDSGASPWSQATKYHPPGPKCWEGGWHQHTCLLLNRRIATRSLFWNMRCAMCMQPASVLVEAAEVQEQVDLRMMLT